MKPMDRTLDHGLWVVALGVALAWLSGCAPPISEGGFDSAQPAAKLYAIRRAGAARNSDAVPKLIEQLDSDDPAVRMFAIEALARITGERRGYGPYAPPYERDMAVARWVDWYKASGSGGSAETAPSVRRQPGLARRSDAADHQGQEAGSRSRR